MYETLRSGKPVGQKESMMFVTEHEVVPLGKWVTYSE